MVSASTFSGLTISSGVVGIFVQAGHPTLRGKKIVDEGPIRHGDGISFRLIEGMGLGTDRSVQTRQESRVESDGGYCRDRVSL